MNPRDVRDLQRKVRQIEIRTNRLVDDLLAGQYHSVFKGSGMDFDRVREYIPGDEVRAIDWNVTARTGSPFVKSFHEERELTILLMVDMSASGEFGSSPQSKREMIADLAAVVAFSAMRNGDKVGLLLFTDEAERYLPPAKGHTHALRIIHELLTYEPVRPGTDVLAAIDFANEVLKRRAVTMLISDFCLPGDHAEALAALRPKLHVTNRQHDLIAISVNDPREFDLPPVGRLTIEDAESGLQVELDTDDLDVRNEYAAEAERRRAALAHTVRSSGVDLIEVRTDEPYLPVLLRFFASRRKRRAS